MLYCKVHDLSFPEGCPECAIAQRDELLAALEFAAAGFAVIANDATTAEHSRSFARDNFAQAKAAIAKAKGE